MAPATFKSVYLFLALVTLPQALAGPGCARRNHGKPDCVKKCGNGWGYQGNSMGSSSWGSVISSYSGDPDSILSTACGSNMPGTPDPVVTQTDPFSCSSSLPTDGYMPTPNVPNSEDPHHFTSTSSIPTISPKPTSTPPPPPATPSTPTSTPRSPSHSSPSPPPPSSSHPPNTLENKPSPTPTSPNVPSPSSQNGTLTDAIKDEVLQDHNDYRAKHGASNLTWADDLAQYAANLVAKCVFKHSGGPHGENLAAGSGIFTFTDGFKMWTAESSDYDPQNPVYSHFTQVVWKSTTQIGCAMKTDCPPGSIFKAEYGNATLVACEYNPPGNIEGEFNDNVQP